jgi:copper(I)-binding protein
MKLYWKILLTTLLLACATARAELVVENGHVRASLPGVASTAAYMTLRNTGAAELVLTGITSPAAAKVSLHSTMNHNGMMHMMSMEALSIPAGGEVKLESGGIHMMLEELTARLEPANEVKLSLEFANGDKQEITLPVRSVME